MSKRQRRTPAQRAVEMSTKSHYGTANSNYRHGMAGTKIYKIWADMVARCNRATHPRWYCYGARGIKVCERRLSFSNFLADMGERPEGKSMDRIDNDGNYEPGNVRWADGSTQSRNRRREAYAGSVHDPVSGRFLPKARAS